MRSFRPYPLIVVLFLQLLPAVKGDTITNVMSPIVSYQYPEDLSSEVLTNGGIMSPIVSYQYYEWPGNNILQLVNSLPVSYFYNVGIAQGQTAPYGQITGLSGTPLPGATIMASVLQTVEASGQAASDGNYALSALPPGVYVLQVTMPGYTSSTRIITLNSVTAQQNFQLALLPPQPGTVQATQQAPATFTQPPTGPMGSTLEVFDGTEFVPIIAANQPLPGIMTIIMTHGWNSDPTGWPQVMAETLRTAHVSPAIANILAWDWEVAAGGILPPYENTPAQGIALGQALQKVLGANYAQPLHFMGHSLGTMVNAAAANYLHGDQIAQENVSPTPWSSENTYMTLFDQAEASTIAGALIGPYNGLTIFLENPSAASQASQALSEAFTWNSPMPVRSAWADNYVSIFGFYQPNAVNIFLQKTPGYENVYVAHGYPMQWYELSIGPTDASDPFGFGESYEYDLVVGATSFPPPAVDFPLGTDYNQTPSSNDPLALEPLPIGGQSTTPLFGIGPATVVQGVDDAVQTSGSVAATVEDGLQQAGQWIGTGINYAANEAAQGEQSVVNVFDTAVLSVTLQTSPPSSSSPSSATDPHPNIPTPSGTATNTPAMAWLPMQIPSNVIAMAFDFTASGDPQQDSLVCGIAESNLFSLQAQFIPTNTVSSSRLIDISTWAGQEVQLFFGLMGGTSTNAALQVDDIRFYSVAPPSLQAQVSGNTIIISWPVAASGYVLESTDELSTANLWSPVTNAPVIVNSQYEVTDEIYSGNRFYRLQQE
jgi:pimeloyl-ACP methyl ester carboxylesterase